MIATADSRQVAHPNFAPALDATIVRRRVAELRARDNWTRQQLLAHQRERVQAVLHHAVSASPYYRETIGHLVARGAPLEEFPVLTKNQLVANFDRIVTDRGLNLADIERHLAGEHAADLLFGQYRACATGGTTGVRAVMVYDRPAWEYAAANAIRFMVWPGCRRKPVASGLAPLHHNICLAACTKSCVSPIPGCHASMSRCQCRRSWPH